MAKVWCPFCNSIAGDEYAIQLHIEEFHTENSPFVAGPAESSAPAASDNASRSCSSMPRDEWTKCTRRGCGEYVLLSAIDEHLDFHAAAELAERDNEELAPPLPPRRSASPANSSPRSRKHLGHETSSRSSPPEKHRAVSKEDRQSVSSTSTLQAREERPSSRNTLLKYFAGSSSILTRSNLRALLPPPKPGRLGKRELGPRAFEKSMPSDVRKALICGAEARTTQKIGSDGKLYKYRAVSNETAGLPAAIADLCALEDQTLSTYLCHASTKHIYKLECDGNFCGYWSAQVVLSYIQYMDPDGPQSMPHVIEMQEIIERAWKNGICAYDKVQTGGILNTRKWIGTTEAVAFFTEIGVKVDALTFKDGDKSGVEELLDYVEAFYMSGTDTAQKRGSSYITQLPPIYFQRLGHSMTIVGLERSRDGSRNLLVFDSSWATSKPMEQLAYGRNTRSTVGDLLKPYRKSDRSLSTWDEFEVLIPQCQAVRLK